MGVDGVEARQQATRLLQALYNAVPMLNTGGKNEFFCDATTPTAASDATIDTTTSTTPAGAFRWYASRNIGLCAANHNATAELQKLGNMHLPPSDRNPDTRHDCLPMWYDSGHSVPPTYATRNIWKSHAMYHLQHANARPTTHAESATLLMEAPRMLGGHTTARVRCRNY